jgi:hypothetical protein
MMQTTTGRARLALLSFMITAAVSTASAQVSTADVPEDAIPGPTFKPGQVLGMDEIDLLKGYIPGPFWDNRDFFFFEGMTLEIGKLYKAYPISEGRKAANQKFGGQARLGRDHSLEGFTMGRPFPEIDPSDPQAGAKHAWNFHYKHDALEGEGRFFFSYWDNGEELPLSFEGTGWGMRLANRPDHMDRNGDIFDQEKRMGAGGFNLTGPPDYRGISGLGYAYKANDRPRDEARDVDVWIYIPDLRRVRRISGSQRTDSIAGTDMTPEDQGGFQGVVTHFEWEYLGEVDLLAPIDTRLKGYPYSRNENFGPYGFSLGNDIWQLRKAIVLEMTPKERHPYSRKRLWLDKDTYVALYAAAYDRRGELWKLIQLNYHWSEREDQPGRIEGINAFLPSTNIVVNTQTGTGVRIEVYDAQPTRLSRGKIRKRTDIGRLARQGR